MVLYGYSPGPKKSRFNPEIVSNSVFAVPLPIVDTEKLPAL